ncbi:MAG: hypothetical protein L6425_11510, partial [Candidatus Aminicenantes bacterium]|nr:hypothetical protein [Candidatus Aminicenantes bacterium]
TGLQFNLKRNFTGVWGFMANYSLHYASYQKLAFDPTDPEQFVYASPRDLDMDRYGVRWSFHLSTFYRLPWNFMVALFVQGQSGIFLSDRTGDYERTQSAPNVTLSNGRRVADIGWAAFNNYYVGKKWGTQGRYTDDIWSVILTLSKAFQIGQVRLEGYMDIYNLFNWASYASYSSVDIRHDFYADKTKPQSPRSAQVTLKIGFN